MSGQQFRPVGELDEADLGEMVIERRDPVYWQGPLSDAVDRAIDEDETTILVEDGRKVAVITPYIG